MHTKSVVRITDSPNTTPTVNTVYFGGTARNQSASSYTPPQTVFVGGYTVITLSDRVSETFLCPKCFCFFNILKNH